MESKIEKILNELAEMRRDIMRNRCFYSVMEGYVFLISYELYAFLMQNARVYDISLSFDGEGVLKIYGHETVLVDMPEDEVYFTKKQKVSKIKVKETITLEVEAYENDDIEKLVENIADYSDEKTRITNLERKVI